MPTKGTHYLSGKRNLILNKEFYNEVRETISPDLTDKEIREIVLTSNDEIRNAVANTEDGFKMPEQLGYIVITKYKSKKQPIDWVNSKKLKMRVPLLNLHSYNTICHIKWFKIGNHSFGIKEVYKLEPSRKLKRQVAKNIKEGKMYHTWTRSDFWNTNKIFKKLING